MMGLGSIVGTGVFVSIGISAGVAGPAVLLSIGLAALVASFNGLSSAQLAATHPVSGGTYEYGYAFLHPAIGFTAGWMFLIAKSASAATAALGLAGYLLRVAGVTGPSLGSEAGNATPGSVATETTVAVAIAAVIAVTVLIGSGVKRSNRANVVIVSITLIALFLFVAIGLPDAVENADIAFAPFVQGTATDQAPPIRVLAASALMFVAFTGYGRIATLGEEVRQPERTIPRAVIAALVAVTLLYGAVAFVAVGGFGWEPLAAAAERSTAPLEAAAEALGGPLLAAIIAVAAITAMLGVLLNLILGLSRVLLAMGRRGDVPLLFSRLNRSGTAPTPAVIAVGVVVAAIVLIGDVHLTWSFSAFTVLIYYGITNAAALALPPERRRYGRWVSVMGLLGCIGLACFVETRVLVVGLTLVLLGLGWFGVAHLIRSRS